MSECLEAVPPTLARIAMRAMFERALGSDEIFDSDTWRTVDYLCTGAHSVRVGSILKGKNCRRAYR